MRVVTSLACAASAAIVASMLAFCKPVEVIEAADAGQKECKAGPVVFCQPLPAGSNDEGCSSDDPSSKLLTELPRGVRYPTGCAINFVGGRDVAGDCTLAGICRCTGGADAGAPAPIPDGGGDGEARDASGSEAVPVRWTCYP